MASPNGDWYKLLRLKNVGAAIGQETTNYKHLRTSHTGDAIKLTSIESDEPVIYLNLAAPLSTSGYTAIPIIEETDTDTELSLSAADATKTKNSSGYIGWRRGVIAATVTVSLVLCINIGILIWAATRKGSSWGIGVLYEGVCDNSTQIDTSIHFIINILSTLLLGAGNYTMQCLSSPTRAEVDLAHRQGSWLDIGVPSVRNVLRISRSRAVLWWLLGFSSIPLHLLYNSVIYQTIIANEYLVAVVSDKFLTGPVYNTNTSQNTDGPKYIVDPSQNTLLEDLQSRISILQNLTDSDCITAYRGTFVTSRSGVLLVSTSYSNNESVMWTSMISGEASPWVCEDTNGLPCSIREMSALASGWSVGGHNIAYCLSLQVPTMCRFEYSMQLLVAVILCNLIKAVCMAIVICRQKIPTLVTIGDTIASFLESPDSTTAGRCSMSKDDVRGISRWIEADRGKRAYRLVVGAVPTTARAWTPISSFWFRAASHRRWVLCMFLWVMIIVMAGVLLTPVLSSAQDYYGASDMATLWNIGFGTVTAYFLVRTNKAQNGSSELLLSILVANLPQLIFSFLYLLYNGIYTCMLLGYEWASYAKDRKALRVTSPSGKQASTYWLQLPYQYSVPLLVVSGLTHWIVSQSLFLARVGQYQTGEVIGGDLTILVSGVGYSPIAIIFVLIMGGLMVIGIFLNGFRRYHTGIPLAGSCSAAISAACHVPTNDRDAAVSLLQWGEVTSLTPGGVAHCTLTSQQVTLPVAGRLYK